MWKDRDDAKLLFDVIDAKSRLERGLKQDGSAYAWTEEITRIKNHFMLELTTLESILKCKNAGLV